MRTVTYKAQAAAIDGTQFLALAKYLRADDGALERAKGGVWIRLDGDTDAVLASLANAGEQALSFASMCAQAHQAITQARSTAKAPKAVKAPTPPKAPSKPAPASKPTQPPADLDAVRANRTIALANSPKPNGHLRPAAPAKDALAKKAADTDWFALIGQ